MKQHDQSQAAPMQTILILIALVPIVGGFVLLGSTLGVHALYMGFIFCTYWGAIKGLAPAEFLPALFGALLGLGLAYALHALPAQFGTAGLVMASAMMTVALYFMIRQQFQLVINQAFVLFLTIATIPALSAEGDYPGMLAGLVLGAGYAGLLLAMTSGRALLRARGRRAEVQVDPACR